MTSLEDKADDGPDTDVILADSSPGRYRVESIDLVDAGEIGDPDGFPQYGEFLPVMRMSETGEIAQAYLETPQELARILVDCQADVGTVFVITDVDKDVEGRWTYEIRVEGPDQTSLDDA